MELLLKNSNEQYEEQYNKLSTLMNKTSEDFKNEIENYKNLIFNSSKRNKILQNEQNEIEKQFNFIKNSVEEKTITLKENNDLLIEKSINIENFDEQFIELENEYGDNDELIIQSKDRLQYFKQLMTK